MTDRVFLSALPFRFCGNVGRRFGLEIAGIFAIKLPLLLLLWLVAIRPAQLLPVDAAAMAAHVYSPSPSAHTP